MPESYGGRAVNAGGVEVKGLGCVGEMGGRMEWGSIMCWGRVGGGEGSLW